MRAVRATAAVILCAVLPLSGCAGVWRGSARAMDRAPNGLTRADDALRRALVAGSFADAVRQAEAPGKGAPGDRLLRALYQGTASYYAGDYPRTIRAMADADRMIEERFTKSLSAGALALVTNDMAMPYLPSRTEQLFVRYYTMMAYAQSGDAGAAAVEARRLGRQLEDDGGDLAPAERPLHAVLRDAAGAVFESVGETNDALVSYRNAALLRGASPADVDAIQLERPEGDSATLVVLIESGFVAHRVNRSLLIPLDDGSDSRRRRPRGIALRDVAIRDVALRDVASRDVALRDVALRDVALPPAVLRDGASPDGASRDLTNTTARQEMSDSMSPLTDADSLGADDAWMSDRTDAMVFADQWDSDRVRNSRRGQHWRYGNAARWVRIAWPALQRSPMPTGQVAMIVDTSRVEPSGYVGDVTSAIAEDLRRARPAMVARMTARAAVKTAASEAFDGEHQWVGTLISMAAAGVEQADTRSWQLLPGSVRTVRITVRAGTHEPVLQIGDAFDRITVRLPQVNVARGSVTVLDARIWRDAAGMVAGVP